MPDKTRAEKERVQRPAYTSFSGPNLLVPEEDKVNSSVSNSKKSWGKIERLSMLKEMASNRLDKAIEKTENFLTNDDSSCRNDCVIEIQEAYRELRSLCVCPDGWQDIHGRHLALLERAKDLLQQYL